MKSEERVLELLGAQTATVKELMLATHRSRRQVYHVTTRLLARNAIHVVSGYPTVYSLGPPASVVIITALARRKTL